MRERDPMKHTSESEQPDAAEAKPERRRHPRVYQNLPAEIGLAEDKALNLTALNISLSGVQFGCNEEQMQRIKNDGHPALHGATVEVGLRVELPMDGGPAETLEATCRLVYTRRVTQHRYCLGMQFTHLKGQGRDALLRYLLEAPHKA